MTRDKVIRYLGQLRITMDSSNITDRQARQIASFAAGDLIRRLDRKPTPAPAPERSATR